MVVTRVGSGKEVQIRKGEEEKDIHIVQTQWKLFTGQKYNATD